MTSWWHSTRATVLIRAALRGSRVKVTAMPARSGAPVGLLLRELCSFAALPVQVLGLRRVAPPA